MNAWQCERCGKVSRDDQAPATYAVIEIARGYYQVWGRWGDAGPYRRCLWTVRTLAEAEQVVRMLNLDAETPEATQ